MEDKYKKLVERIRNNDIEMDDLVPTNSNYMEKALEARDLAQGALGSEYLKQTGVSVPDIKRASNSQIESFLNKLKEEAYPELNKNSIELNDFIPAKGEFDPNTGKIELSKKYLPTKEDMVGTAFHELGHAYDQKKGTLNSKSLDLWTPEKKELLKNLGIKSGKDLTKLDSSDISEIVQLGHHTNIPKLREGSFGLGALKSLLKNNTFKKTIPFIGPAIAGAATLASTGDVSAATQDMTPILNEAEGLGPERGSLEEQVENPSLSREQRQKAIESLLNRNKLGE